MSTRTYTAHTTARAVDAIITGTVDGLAAERASSSSSSRSTDDAASAFLADGHGGEGGAVSERDAALELAGLQYNIC